VRVVVTLDPIEGGGRTQRLQRTVDEVAQGAEAEVTLPIDQRPPAGSAVTVGVEVEPVPGEELTDNNSQDYEVLFE